MKYKLSEYSHDKLYQVHPHLIMVVCLGLEYTEQDFRVLEGVRSLEKQRKMVENKRSKTMNSRHLLKETEGGHYFAHAVDLGAVDDGVVVWDWPSYHQIAKAMKRAAKDLNVPIEWGGDWKSFPDGPHWQLPWKRYPVLA